MRVDQEWVRENSDKMVGVFLNINPRFQDKRYKSGLSQHKRAMLGDADTLSYRPIYHIARDGRVQKLKDGNARLYHKLRTECEKVERLKAGYEAARGRIVAEFGEKSHEYDVFSGAFSLSPSSHSPPASRLNVPSSPRPSPSLD